MITTVEQLEALYGTPAEPALVKEIDHLTPEYRRLIELSPFVLIATAGPDGLDCSPRGDAGAVARV
ncbi:MAG: pyridoxamine 5'-phosphate oxidase family protein, partial [Pseudolabrys sp.]